MKQNNLQEVINDTCFVHVKGKCLLCENVYILYEKVWQLFRYLTTQLRVF
jgi:hypothetical protein